MNRSTLYKVEVMKAYLEGTPISVNGNKPVTKPTQIEWNWADNDYTIYKPVDTTVYPALFKHIDSGIVAEFVDATTATVTDSGTSSIDVGYVFTSVYPCTYTTKWTPYTDTDTCTGPIEAPIKAPTEIVLEEWLLEADGDYIVVETSNIAEFTDELTTAVKLLSTRTIILD